MNTLTAVIIDDHPLACVAIRALLESEGIKVVAEAGDGGDALALVMQHKPDVVIVDVDIPGISGVEVVEMLRAQNFRSIIIVVSAKNQQFYGKRSADVGANGFISKKEGMDNIIDAIRAASKGYSYFPFDLNSHAGALTSDEQKLQSLSSQEVKVMRAILQGSDNNKIASEMNISVKTVSTYKSRLFEKLECKTLLDLYTFANRSKIG
jgi:two-component system, NarL family, response regulator EvgA